MSPPPTRSREGAPARADLPPFPFIVARGRSGTTLLRAMLDAHPDMAVPGESHFVVQFAMRRARYEAGGSFDVDRFIHDLLRHWGFRRWRLPAAEVLEAYETSPPADFAAAIRTAYAAYARHHGKARYADKTPSYVLHVDLLGAVFPDARFIHLIRDGRDVALSYIDADFGPRTLGHAAISWDRFVRAGRAAGSRLGTDRYREVRYEDLVREPEKTLGELCSFIGLAFDERMMRYPERAEALASTLSHEDHHRNLYRAPTAGLRDWRRELQARDVAAFEAIAGDLLEELGYELAYPRRVPAMRVRVARLRIGAHARRLGHGLRIRARKAYRRSRRRLLGAPVTMSPQVKGNE